MTIKIENDETTLCLLRPETTTTTTPHHHSNTPPTTTTCHRLTTTTRQHPPPSSQTAVAFDDQGDVIMCTLRHHDAPSDPFGDQLSSRRRVVRNGVGSIMIESSPVCEKDFYSFDDSSEDDFVDDDSTVSTYSCSSDEDSQGTAKRVRFCDQLVSEVRTRPRTPPEALRTLFYTCEETQRFRQEYRLERKLLARLDTEHLSNFPSQSSCDSSLSTTSDPCPSSNSSKRNSRHRISRVLVLHNDVLETFYDEDVTTNKTNIDQQQQPVLEQYQQQLPLNNNNKSVSPDCASSDDFFDNDSFWSGSITW
eukprot:CAMPEP_0172514688 /NCGR_PEP_ID=MMETSP1066-20121228/262004_1 /TAXON_ID=671091 /ORGANISM="Coscinodiscus wailesii, Strain CCMP2513" /LENGTH=306 /DNA_ID=CAMNT_0013295459 /DNA_START=44 /DNA_END=961 /DNA_ORIENTATION=+